MLKIDSTSASKYRLWSLNIVTLWTFVFSSFDGGESPLRNVFKWWEILSLNAFVPLLREGIWGKNDAQLSLFSYSQRVVIYPMWLRNRDVLCVQSSLPFEGKLECSTNHCGNPTQDKTQKSPGAPLTRQSGMGPGSRMERSMPLASVSS